MPLTYKPNTPDPGSQIGVWQQQMQERYPYLAQPQPGQSDSPQQTQTNTPTAYATPEDAQKSAEYGNRLSTWLQNFNPEESPAPFIDGQQTPSEQVGGKSEWKTGTDVYDWMKGFEDPEEAAKRERSNNQKLGIVALGDALRHMGNIYHASRYAPAQKLSNATKELHDRQQQEDLLMQKQRREAANLLMQQEKYKMDAYYKQRDDERKGQELALKQQQMEGNKTYRDAQIKKIEAGIEDAKRRHELAVQAQKHKEQNDKERNAIARANLQERRASRAETARHHKVMEGLSRQRVQNAVAKGSGSLGGNKTHNLYYSGGNVISVPKSVDSATNVSMLYGAVVKKLPPGERLKANAKNTADQRAFILEHLDDPMVSEALGNMGAEIVSNLAEDMETEEGKGLWETLLGISQDVISDTHNDLDDAYDDIEFLMD